MSKILTDEELREMEKILEGGSIMACRVTRLIQSHRALQEELSEARDAFRKLNLQALENHNRMTKERDSLREKLAIAEEALESEKEILEDGGAYVVEDGFDEPAECARLRIITKALARLRKDAP